MLTDQEFVVLEVLEKSGPLNFDELWPRIWGKTIVRFENHGHALIAFDKFLAMGYLTQYGEARSGNTQYLINDFGREVLNDARQYRKDRDTIKRLEWAVMSSTRLSNILSPIFAGIAAIAAAASFITAINQKDINKELIQSLKHIEQVILQRNEQDSMRQVKPS